MQNDPTYKFRDAIYSALNGNISYSGRTYQVEKNMKPKYPDYYVRINYPVLTENADYKGGYIFNGTIQIEVVNQRYSYTHSNEVEMSDIVDDINTLIVNTALSMTGFTLIVGMFVTGYETTEVMNTETTNEIKKIISYSFQIQQS